MAEDIQANERPILVPVDFSDDSQQALALAVRWSRCYPAPIVVLHVVHDPANDPGYYIKSGKNPQLRQIEEAAGEMMTAFLKQAGSDHPELKSPEDLQTMLVVGLPAPRILEIADKLDVRMIVMGSQGRTGLAHMLLGSKAEQVVRLAKVPVTIFRA